MRLPRRLIPVYTRRGWRDYYIARFEKTGSQQAVILAMWYDFLLLFEGER